MTTLHLTPIRLTGALAITLLVTACGSGEVEVRHGPQEVHPAPPAISHFDSHCHSHSGKGCHTHAGDGSRPIID